MAKILNISGDNYNQFFYQILDGRFYTLHVYYNDRNKGWYISIYDYDLYDENSSDNTSALLMGGKRLMPYQNVLKNNKNTNLPQGTLVCIDTDFKSVAEQEPPTIGTFGINNRYQLVYFTSDEVEVASS